MPPPPLCPRCGYDQTGVISSWQHSCPLTGICPECGLDFPWRNLLNPDHASHLSLFEHAQSHRLRAWWRTTRKTWRPRRFWKWLRIDQEIRPRRLFWGALTGTLASYTIGCAAGLAIYSLFMLLLNLQFSFHYIRSFLFEDALFEYLAPPVALIQEGVPLAWVACPILFAAAMPLTFLLLPFTFHRIRIRRAHLARIWLYGCVSLALVWCIPIWLGTLTSVTMFFLFDVLFPDADSMAINHLIDLAGDAATLGWWIAWTIWWWYRAARDYLRLPRPGLVTLLLALLAFIASWAILTLFALLWPSILIPTEFQFW